MQNIIFNILKSNAHTWVRYWVTKELTGLTLPGEYIEIRSNYLAGDEIKELFEAGFKIETITTQKINADAFCEVLFKRDISASKP